MIATLWMRKQALKDHLVKIIHREVASQAWTPGLSNPGGYELHCTVTGRKNSSFYGPDSEIHPSADKYHPFH